MSEEAFQVRRASWAPRTVAILTILAAFPSFAADTLPISGPYGNAAGCQLHKEGTGDDDSLLLLTPDFVRSYGTGCEILQVLPARDGSFLVTGICGFEGDDEIGARMMVIPNLLRISLRS